jgi:hypothetical protein
MTPARFIEYHIACMEMFECLKGGDSAVWMGPRSLLEDAHAVIAVLLRTHRVPHVWSPRFIERFVERRGLPDPFPPRVSFIPNIATGASSEHVPLLVIENALEWDRHLLMEALMIPAPSPITGRRPEVLFVGHTEKKTREFLGPLGVLLT